MGWKPKIQNNIFATNTLTKTERDRMEYKLILRELEENYGWTGTKEFTEMQRELICDVDKIVSRVELPVKVNFADFKLAISLLRDLADLQNGSPLVTCEKEWQRTMDNIYVFLNEHESKISA